MKKQLTQEEQLLAAKTKSDAIADDILDEEEAQFIDGGPVDENGLPLNAKSFGDQIDDPFLKINSDPLFGGFLGTGISRRSVLQTGAALAGIARTTSARGHAFLGRGAEREPRDNAPNRA